jgi:hypothetical protein
VLTVNARMPRRMCAVGACGLAALAVAPAAQAQVANVRPDKNVSVFTNVGFVAALNYAPGSPMNIELLREGHPIARASGPAVATRDGAGLEVNHGPDGAPQPGDCWSNFTPRLQPGDELRITGDGATDTVTVDDIQISSVREVNGDVVVEGIAFYGDGTPIPVEALDSGEVRNVDPVVRANPTSIVEGDTAGTWIATYSSEQGYGVISGKGDDQPASVQLDQILTGDHSMGYGHAALPSGATAPVMQLAEGIGDESGPAAGCEGVAPLMPDDAITMLSDDVVNVGSGDLTVGGVSDGSTPVSVTLDNPLDAAGPVTVDADVGFSGAWSATVSRTQLDGLSDGRLTVSANVGANTLSLAKDTTLPAAIAATPAPGTYATGQLVTLGTGDPTDVIRYTRNGSTPTATSARASGQISIPTSQTIKAFATDAAGNAGPVQTLTYTIGVADTAAPSSGGQSSGAQATAPTTAGDQVTSVTVPAPIAPSTKTSKPTLRQLAMSPRVKRSTARTSGIRLSMRVADDAAVVRIRVYRKLANGKRVLVATGWRSPSKAGLYRTRLTDPKLRARLRTGSYEVEATPGAARTSLGTPSRVGFKVVKG